MHSTRWSGSRIRSISAEVTSDFFHGSSSVRSTTSTCGQCSRSRSAVGWTGPSGPASSSMATSVGIGDTYTTGTPARKHRSAITSRACHVGDRSSWSASSCSSITIAAAIPAHGIHAADRVPTTTSTPPGRGRPVVGNERDGGPGPAEPRGEQRRVGGSGHHHERRPERDRRQHRREHVAARRKPKHPASRLEQLGGRRR